MINLCDTCRHKGKHLVTPPCVDCRNGEHWEKGKRPTILPKPVPVYEYEHSEYPELIRISFSDGTTAVYELRTDQPHPVIMENIKIIRKWKTGYVNQPARRRRRRG